MSYEYSHDGPSRPTRYRSTNQPSHAYTMATTFNNGSSRPLPHQHPTEVYQHGQSQIMASSSSRFDQFSPQQHWELSQQDSMSSINTRFSDLWPRQMPLLPENREESPEVVHMKATRLTTSLLMAEPFKLKSIDQLYDEAMESEDEKERKKLKHEQLGLRG